LAENEKAPKIKHFRPEAEMKAKTAIVER